ncbi:LutC/YkgG family protein [Pseudodesulfovibrio senegalensis]|jgi:L-lactate dehydrogenase complex protein LldG|uniref:Lactate utilization protein n=1 Tax=Pseudodesulfovibrio senegalensis TaxID=1721087 RepID=A0A6N6N614_9BACT|nr:lactate utilization protein [Pseudodesulfovibrio senegalensis]KAB1443333.1 lactate utilization protein [Pseudodesulfovibrio senegalensis]
MTNQECVALFTEKATAVSAVVTEIKKPVDALNYVVELCDKKEACQLMPVGCEQALSDEAEAVCETKQGKIVAAPGLDSKTFKMLKTRCEKAGLELIDSGMRDHLAGIDIGFTEVQHGIAETGTLVLASKKEEVRLATMVSEIHVALLPKSKIVETSYDVEKHLLDAMKDTPDYHAFITGASRTADIERVLALGVHGPLELHILLLED